MEKRSPVIASAEEVALRFAHFSELSHEAPVLVVKDGRPANVLLSMDEFERLRARDSLAFRAEDTPDHFLQELEALRDELDRDQRA